jgi:uncharacterized membrane protein
VLDDARHKILVLVFRILAIEDAVFLALQADTPETVFAAITIIAIAAFGAHAHAAVTTDEAIPVRRETLVAKLRFDRCKVAVHAI